MHVIRHHHEGIEEERVHFLHSIQDIDHFACESGISKEWLPFMGDGGNQHGNICLDRMSLGHEGIMQQRRTQGWVRLGESLLRAILYNKKPFLSFEERS